MSADLLPSAFTHQLARSHGLSERALRGLLYDGKLDRIGHGLHRSTQAPPANLDYVEIALRAPQATLCLSTAIAYHDLTDSIPAAIDVALPRSHRQPLVTAQVRWHRFADDTFAVGRGAMEVDVGLHLGVYSAERSMIDAFRLRDQEGEDLAIAALRRWLRRPDARPASLLAMARHVRKAEAGLLQVLRILS